MDHIFESGASGTAPTIPSSPSSGYATDGNPLTATPATIPGEYWYHMITESLRNAIVAAGLTPNGADLTLLKQSIPLLASNQLPPGQKVGMATIWTSAYVLGIASGKIGATVGSGNIVNTNGSFTKGNPESAWTAGSGNSGLPAALVGYTGFLIAFALSDGVGGFDIGFDANYNASILLADPNVVAAGLTIAAPLDHWFFLPGTGFTKGSWNGDSFVFDVQPKNLDGGTSGTVAPVLISAPPGQIAKIIESIYFSGSPTSSGLFYGLVTATNQTDTTPALSCYDVSAQYQFGAYETADSTSKDVSVDSSGNIQYRLSSGTGEALMDIFTVGFRQTQFVMSYTPPPP